MPPAKSDESHGSGYADPFAHWIVLLHAEGLGARAESIQAKLRGALEEYVRTALADAGVRSMDCRLRSRDPGLVVLVPPATEPALLLRDFVRSLDDHLRSHNITFRETHQLSLCLGVHYGMVALTGEHWSSRAIHELSTLVAAVPGEAHRRSGLVVVVSDAVHQAVVLAGIRGIRPPDYAPLEVPPMPEGQAPQGWVTVAGEAGPPRWAPALALDAPDQRWPRDRSGQPHAGHEEHSVPGLSGPLIHPDFRLGDGGQGMVYAVVREVAGLHGPLAYKEYRHDVFVDPGVLEDMVRFLGDLERSAPADHAFLESRLAWPLRLGHRGGSPSGFVMRQVPEQYTLHSRHLGGPRQQTLEFLLNPDPYLQRIGLSVGNEQRLLILKDLASIIGALHRYDVAVGDLSPKNILFRLDIWPRCFLIDCDSMRFKGRDALPQVETPGWECPDSSKATQESDVYKFGLMALRLFNRDQDSLDGTALREQSPQLAELAQSSLSTQPSARPTMTEWQVLLQQVIEGGKWEVSWVDVETV